MIGRPLRLVALLLAVSASALALSSCASTLNDAATITYHDKTGDHTVHISRADLLADMRELVGRKDIRDALASRNYKPGDGTEATDAQATADWLTNLIHQKVIAAEYKSQGLKLSADDRTKADPEVKQSWGNDYAKFSKRFRSELVDNQAMLDAVRSSNACPSDKLVAHILFKTQAEAEQALAKIKADKSQFGAIARSSSLDTGSKKNSGILGCLAPGQYVPEFQNAADNAPLDTPIGPVKSQFGYHLIYVTKWDPSILQQSQDFQQSQQAALQAALNDRVAKLKVHVDPRFGTWQRVPAQDGTNTFVVVVPNAPSPRAQREKS